MIFEDPFQPKPFYDSVLEVVEVHYSSTFRTARARIPSMSCGIIYQKINPHEKKTQRQAQKVILSSFNNVDIARSLTLAFPTSQYSPSGWVCAALETPNTSL